MEFYIYTGGAFVLLILLVLKMTKGLNDKVEVKDAAIGCENSEIELLQNPEVNEAAKEMVEEFNGEIESELKNYVNQ